MKKAKTNKKTLQDMLDRSRFLRPWGFRVAKLGDGECTLQLPHRADLERPGGIINGPALMAAADCAMWVAIKTRIGIERDALTAELNTAFLSPANGKKVFCTAKILKFGNRRIYGVAECHDRGGKLYSHHTLTYARIGGGDGGT